MQEKKTLTFVVPAYNMTEYLERCVMSLIAAKRNDDIEVLIVDDGSSDGTLEMAQKFEARYPGIVRAIHQENKGHGGAVNTGIAAASGMYVKVVDADDLGHFGLAEYILMHALTYRTAVVRESGMQLPEHTFYVDFIYAYQPFPWVKTMKYLDTPFYHYFIGRDGQSVQTDVMIRRVDQLRLVNQCMVRATPEHDTVPDGLYRYMIHFLAIESSVASVFMILSRDPENYEKKKDMWDDIKAYSPTIYKDVRKKAMSRALNLRGSIGRFVIRKGYFVAEHVVGFN